MLLYNTFLESAGLTVIQSRFHRWTVLGQCVAQTGPKRGGPFFTGKQAELDLAALQTVGGLVAKKLFSLQLILVRRRLCLALVTAS